MGRWLIKSITEGLNKNISALLLTSSSLSLASTTPSIPSLTSPHFILTSPSNLPPPVNS